MKKLLTILSFMFPILQIIFTIIIVYGAWCIVKNPEIVGKFAGKVVLGYQEIKTK